MTLAEAYARFRSGEMIPPNDPSFSVVFPIMGETLRLIGKLNAGGAIAEALL